MSANYTATILKQAGAAFLGGLLTATSFHSYAEQATDYVAIPPLINLSASGDKPNVLFILDNSNSMDEAPSGQAVGSANPGSKSEITRSSIKNIINNYRSTARMGLMAYKQSGIDKRRLHDSQYDVSYDPSSYNPNYNGNRDSATKKYRIPNPADPGKYLYYNIALPFYAGSNQGTAFCYSSSANFDNGSEIPNFGPWDTYACYGRKTGTNNSFNNFSNHRFNSRFTPTDSDYAQNILDFGTHLTWQYVSYTWFANSSPGRGFLHAEVKSVDNTQYTKLMQKLDTSQFDVTSDTPLRNAGLTPIQGSLQSALRYFQGSLPSNESFTSGTPSAPPTNSCDQQDYVILVTDGLPSVDANGNTITDTAQGINNAAAEAANLLSQGIKTYVIGFALPNGVDGTLLDTIAAAGGTDATYLANDSDSLNDALQKIFLSFANRDASSSSSAVLANNSRGEGAVFQAIYSPQREDSLGNEVNWIGNLFGLFIDDRGLIREDTNGNDTLDDYQTDRAVQYFFNTSLGRTQVNLYTGSGPNSPPNYSTDTPVDTVDVDDLKTIWEARRPLSNISDVLTQRTYSSDASSGRHILTSTDSSNLIDFIEVSEADLADLIVQRDAAHAVLQEAENDLNVTRAQYEAAVTTVDEYTGQNSGLLAAYNTAQAAFETAEADYNTANAAFIAAQNATAASTNAYNTATSNYTDNNLAHHNQTLGELSNYQSELSNAVSNSAQADFDSLVNELVNQGANTTDPTVQSALANLNAAQANLAGLQNALSTEVSTFQNSVGNYYNDTHSIYVDVIGTNLFPSAEHDEVTSQLATLNTNFVNARLSAQDLADESEVNSARLAYYDALIATGVDPNIPSVSAARATYSSSQLAESAGYDALLDTYNADLSNAFNALHTTGADIVSQYDAVAAAETAEAAAQAALTAAQTELTLRTNERDDAQTALANSSLDLLTAQEVLASTTISYNDAQSVYNSALAAYNAIVSSISTTNELISHLDVNSVEEALKTIRFVRGDDTISGFRSRSIDFDNDGTAEVWRLGDIIHSSPVLVGTPSERYDTRYLDTTYAAFREQYKNRRNVIYAGANDGMLHAFNAGFWNLRTRSFNTASPDGGLTEHPLGTELWAYIPRAALPHLQWMTDESYGHSYYVDGEPITFDANIFPPDSKHPFGWGTVLMIGMRFGGGEIDIDTDADGTDDTTLRSSYILLDITDPESPPNLLAEISDPQLGFTTSKPSLITKRAPSTNFNNPSRNEWYVAFGSGPTELQDATSDQNAKLFVYNLKTLSFETGYSPLDLGEANSFVGDIRTFDFGNDFIDDMLYFGISTGTPETAAGKVMRTRLDMAAASSTSTLINTQRPVISQPLITVDQLGEIWVSFGTGRLFSGPDNVTVRNQYFYGVLEPTDNAGALSWGQVVPTSLEDVTDIDVIDDGSIQRNGGPVQIPSGTTVETFNDLITAIKVYRDGWIRELPNDGSTPATRNVSRAAIGGNIVFFSSYTPSPNVCQPEGTSQLYGIDMRTGTAVPFEVFAVDDDPSTTEGDISEPFADLGQGLASAPIIIQNSTGTTVFTSKSTTEQLNTAVRIGVYTSGRQSWRQINFD